MAVDVVRGNPSNQEPQQLRLDELRNIVSGLVDGSDRIRATICSEEDKPQVRGIGASLQFLLPCVVECSTRILRLIRLGQPPQIILSEEDLVTSLHHWRHPIECQPGENGRVLDWTFFFLLDCLVAILVYVSGPKPLHEELKDRKSKANAVDDKVCKILGVELLGH